MMSTVQPKLRIDLKIELLERVHMDAVVEDKDWDLDDKAVVVDNLAEEAEMEVAEDNLNNNLKLDVDNLDSMDPN